MAVGQRLTELLTVLGLHQGRSHAAVLAAADVARHRLAPEPADGPDDAALGLAASRLTKLGGVDGPAQVVAGLQHAELRGDGPGLQVGQLGLGLPAIAAGPVELAQQ